MEICFSALEEAFGLSKPEIFNADQGSQFTSPDFAPRLEKVNIRISMDGRSHVYDNIFVKRLWRSVKYEEGYPNDCETVSDARNGITRYFHMYNIERLYESLGFRTPYEIYIKERLNINPVQALTIHLNQLHFLSRKWGVS